MFNVGTLLVLNNPPASYCKPKFWIPAVAFVARLQGQMDHGCHVVGCHFTQEDDEEEEEEEGEDADEEEVNVYRYTQSKQSDDTGSKRGVGT